MARILYIIFLFVLITFSNLNIIISSYQQPYVIYGNEATSERSLPYCDKPSSACNIVYNRFWLSPMIIRLCKCTDRTECPWRWTTDDNYTMNFNNRAQLKFCSRVGDLRTCNNTELAMVTTKMENDTTDLSRTARVLCCCPKTHFYDLLHFNGTEDTNGNLIQTQYYNCLLMQSCTAWDFCGHITTDRYETYHVCSCPTNHICIMENRHSTHVVEPLYEGLAYRGLCTPSVEE